MNKSSYAVEERFRVLGEEGGHSNSTYSPEADLSILAVDMVKRVDSSEISVTEPKAFLMHFVRTEWRSYQSLGPEGLKG